jgi:hypothetical protein
LDGIGGKLGRKARGKLERKARRGKLGTARVFSSFPEVTAPIGPLF